MEDAKKMVFKAELAAMGAIASAVQAQTALLNNATYNVSGPIVTIPAIPAAGQAIKTQNDVITKLIALLDKIIEAA